MASTQEHPKDLPVKKCHRLRRVAIIAHVDYGKTTLFNALTKNNVLVANYPFATIEPNVGMMGVPDDRIGRLAAVFDSDKLLPAVVAFEVS